MTAVGVPFGNPPVIVHVAAVERITRSAAPGSCRVMYEVIARAETGEPVLSRQVEPPDLKPGDTYRFVTRKRRGGDEIVLGTL